MTNPDHVAFTLDEAAMHLRQLVDDIRSQKIGPQDDACLAVFLGHVLDHLCFAWNARDLTNEQHVEQSQEAFEEMANGVPNFQGCRRLFKTTEYVNGA